MPVDAAGDCRWLSAHLVLDPVHGDGLYGGAGDRVALDLVAPLARHAAAAGWARRWFFIRYRDRVPHLRFRLFGPAARLESEARPAIETAAAADPRVGEIAWVPYEPELERYAGAAGVTVAEAIFEASSETALAMLAKLPPAGDGGESGDDRGARLGKALLAALVALHVFLGERWQAAHLMRLVSRSILDQLFSGETASTAAWRDAFERGYERQSELLTRFVDAGWSALETAAGDALPDELAAYRDALVRARGRLAGLAAVGRLEASPGQVAPWGPELAMRLLPSYVHMTNNRLGVRVPEESYLALAVAAALGDSAAPARSLAG